jgi:hypothetical protein
MILRDHPLMSYHRIPSWPPVWTWKDGSEKKLRRGEIGILKAVAYLKLTRVIDRRHWQPRSLS